MMLRTIVTMVGLQTGRSYGAHSINSYTGFYKQVASMMLRTIVAMVWLQTGHS
jgi:hypothetical protein